MFVEADELVVGGSSGPDQFLSFYHDPTNEVHPHSHAMPKEASELCGASAAR